MRHSCCCNLYTSIIHAQSAPRTEALTAMLSAVLSAAAAQVVMHAATRWLKSTHMHLSNLSYDLRLQSRELSPW